MTTSTTSFKPFWLLFIDAFPRSLKKLALEVNRSPICVGKFAKDMNIVFGWEFRKKANGNVDGFQIIIDNQASYQAWFGEFIKKKQEPLIRLLRKEKVEVAQLKIMPPAKLIFMTLEFDPTPVASLLEQKDLVQKCITWGVNQGSQIFKVAHRFYQEFVIFVNNRFEPGEILDRFT